MINCKLIDEKLIPQPEVKNQTPLQEKQPEPLQQQIEQIEPIEQLKQLEQSSQEQGKQSLENNNENTSINKTSHLIMPDSRSYVTITSIPNTQNLFIRQIIGSANTNFLATLETIKKYSKTKFAIKTQPQVGQMFLVYEVTEYGEYHRGIILKMANNNNFIIILIEYGTVLEKNIKDLYYLDPIIQAMPRYVMPVKLKNVTSDMKNEIIINYLKALLDIELQIVYDEPYDENLGVELFTVSKLECINKKIIELYNNTNM